MEENHPKKLEIEKRKLNEIYKDEWEKNGDNPNPTVAHNEISSNGQKEIYET